jgi:hypothetical protein
MSTKVVDLQKTPTQILNPSVREVVDEASTESVHTNVAQAVAAKCSFVIALMNRVAK